MNARAQITVLSCQMQVVKCNANVEKKKLDRNNNEWQ